MRKRTAILIGATGMIGKELLGQLLANQDYGLIKVFARRPTGLVHEKLLENIVDFEQTNEWSGLLIGDVLFSTMGITIKKAKTKKAQYKVDYTFQFETAKLSAENKVQSYVLLSSAGANSKSKIFYSRIKGELDETVQDLSFNKIAIVRPSVLDGNREEYRQMEKISIKVSRLIARILPPLKKWRPIHASIVAKAMINADLKKEISWIYELEEVFQLAKD
ncbi:MAG: semialdehyde dehydrogenase [Bacteroidales bacterium]|nr:semialdehyde dehydrogenase [Bacteroidales bacterium]MCF8455969.1 semialdehyde dehydrogenase [Bacteroidales bacterium]